MTDETGLDIEARLAAAAEAMRERETVTAQLAAANSRLADVDGRIAGHTARLADEEQDVRRLEGLSLTRVLAGLKRTYGEDLDRERAERDAAAYRLREAQAQRDLLQRDADHLAQRIVRLRGAREAWTAVLAEKETHLSRHDGPRAEALLALSEERGRLRSEQREVGEALAAAADADQAIAELQEHLKSADGWSTYDTFFGGGALSSAVKHDRIDAAQRAASYAETRLAVLSTELRDVGGGGPVAPSLGVDGLTRFVDIWFDNMFTDWAVAKRISRAQDSARGARRAVHDVTRQLSHRQQSIATRSASLERRRIELLSGSPQA